MRYHVMVDLETLGTVAGCVILSIGAVQFDPLAGRLGREYYGTVSTESCKDHYLSVSEGTQAWWDRQHPDARAVVDQCAAGGPTLPEALSAFNTWLQSVSRTKSDIRLYGNGADFDNPILSVAYDAAHIKPHYATYGGRCYRTLKNLDELFGPLFIAPKLARSGQHHNALDDAKSQALHLIDIVRQVRANMGDK